MIDLREDGLAQLQFANQLGSQIGGTIAGIYNIKQKKLQQLKEEETQKAVVNIASDYNLTSAQALRKLKEVKGIVNYKMSELDKMIWQQTENIRQQNAAIAPQVKSQMFDAARGMDFNGLTPDMMAQERQAGNAVNAYGQLDRATGFSVPELGQMAQPTNQPLDGRMNDTFGRPLQGATNDMFSGIANTINASAAQARYDLLNQPEEKYGTKPWWMHPDYKDTPEGIAAMQAATRIPGTGTRTAGTTSKGTTTANGITTPEVKPLTPSDENALNKQALELKEQMKRVQTPEQIAMIKEQLAKIYGKLGTKYQEPKFTESIATDIFKKTIFGDGDKNKGIGKGAGRATEGETQIAFDSIVSRFMDNGATWEQANKAAVRLYDSSIEEDDSAWFESRLPEGKTGKDFVRTPPVNMPPEQPAQEQPEYTTGSGNNQSGTQGVVGNTTGMPTQRPSVMNEVSMSAQDLLNFVTGKPNTSKGNDGIPNSPLDGQTESPNKPVSLVETLGGNAGKDSQWNKFNDIPKDNTYTVEQMTADYGEAYKNATSIPSAQRKNAIKEALRKVAQKSGVNDANFESMYSKAITPMSKSSTSNEFLTLKEVTDEDINAAYDAYRKDALKTELISKNIMTEKEFTEKAAKDDKFFWKYSKVYNPNTKSAEVNRMAEKLFINGNM